jgi:hypothetical protein
MRTPQPVTVVLSHDEALVLFEWLSRFNAADEGKFEDQAEQQALWHLEAILESVLIEPLGSGYGELLTAARSRLRDRDKGD